MQCSAAAVCPEVGTDCVQLQRSIVCASPASMGEHRGLCESVFADSQDCHRAWETKTESNIKCDVRAYAGIGSVQCDPDCFGNVGTVCPRQHMLRAALTGSNALTTCHMVATQVQLWPDIVRTGVRDGSHCNPCMMQVQG